jgi:hypothetical protein
MSEENSAMAIGGPFQRKHTPPEEKFQGGSWEFSTITGAYHMMSSTRIGGKMVPSPADPSVYDSMHRIAAELARSGDYSLLTSSTPESYLEPNKLPESFDPVVKHTEKLCRECSIVIDRLYVELTLIQSPRKYGSYEPYGVQMDVDIKPSLTALKGSAESGCAFCKFLVNTLQHVSAYQLERHSRDCGTRDFPIQIIGIPGNHYVLMVWFRNPHDLRLKNRTRAFSMCATITGGMIPSRVLFPSGTR